MKKLKKLELQFVLKPLSGRILENECDMKDAAGYKVTHNLTHPGMCILMDEVGVT